VPSKAFSVWQTLRQEQLDELYDAHAKVGGKGRGRRYATQELNHALVSAVSAQFQGYCRDLHDEAGVLLSNEVGPNLRGTFLLLLQQGRKLDQGNANEGNIGSDFWKLGFAVWQAPRFQSKRARQHRGQLKKLNLWRNAIAHQDFKFDANDLVTLGGQIQPRLVDVRNCHRACLFLAEAIDHAVSDFLTLPPSGKAPW
jgi:hypothetical protein